MTRAEGRGFNPLSHPGAPLYHFSETSFFFFLKILFIYLTDRDHKQAERQAEREEEEAGSLPSREPDAGLNPRALGS